MEACSRLSGLKEEKLKLGKSRVRRMMAKMEKKRIEISSRCLSLGKGNQNLAEKVSGPLRQ